MFSPFWYSDTWSVKVTTGRAIMGEAGVVRLNTLLNCSMLMRRRTFSCATMTAPAVPKFSFPPEWSPWKWVLKT